MTVTEILIIYLAFGAPIAVYKYLQSRDLPKLRRSITAVVTFLFWIPAAVQIGRLYISNAYLGDGFVSPVDSDSSEILIADLREGVRSELIRLGAGHGMHDVRETVDRYVGLAVAIKNRADGATANRNFFEAAGRRNSDLSSHCMKIRNRRRLERHHTQSRKDLLKLFSGVADSVEYKAAVKSALKLTRQLGDRETLEALRQLTGKVEVWNSEQKHQSQSLNPIPVGAAGPLHGD